MGSIIAKLATLFRSIGRGARAVRAFKMKTKYKLIVPKTNKRIDPLEISRQIRKKKN
jgi:hypothetical protein